MKHFLLLLFASTAWAYAQQTPKIHIGLPVGYHSMEKQGVQTLELPAITVNGGTDRVKVGITNYYFWKTENPFLGHNKNVIKYFAYNFGSGGHLDLQVKLKGNLSAVGVAGASGPGIMGFLNHLTFYAGYGLEYAIPIIKQGEGKVSFVLRGERRHNNTVKLLGHLDNRAAWDFNGKSLGLIGGLRVELGANKLPNPRWKRDDRDKVRRREQRTKDA